MNAPLIYIVAPGIVALMLYAVRRWQRAIHLAGFGLSLLLAGLAWQIPIGRLVPVNFLPGTATIELEESLVFLGRQFILPDSMRPILMMIYLATALWVGGAYFAKAHRLFVPFAIGITALLTAALSVEPFLYAALLIEMAVLLTVPLLAQPGQPVGRGIIRFLVFQTIGFPFILFAGWVLTGLETGPVSSETAVFAALMIGLGFVFISAIFPFHTWIPMLSEEAHPYAAGFVFFFIPTVVSLFGLNFFLRYTWLGLIPAVPLALRTLGALMVLLGGMWSAFQRHLGRLMGYATMMEIGYSLLALGLVGSINRQVPAGELIAPETQAILYLYLGIFFVQILPRGFTLVVWAEALSILKQKIGGLHLQEVTGAAQKLPIVSASITLAQFSIAGVPLLAAFPARIALWSSLSIDSLGLAFLTLIGSIGFLIGGLRSTATILKSERNGERSNPLETGPQRILLAFGWVILLVIGLFPNWYFPVLTRLAALIAQP